MSSPASSQILKVSEHTVANAQDTPSDVLGAALSPTRSKVANTEVTLHTKPQAANVKVAQERGLRFWLILVALGSALCLVSIELVRLAETFTPYGVEQDFHRRQHRQPSQLSQKLFMRTLSSGYLLHMHSLPRLCYL